MPEQTGVSDRPGLGERPMNEWPRAAQTSQKPIEILKPESDQHKHVLAYLLKRLEESERRMTQFHARWSFNEKRFQAFIDLPDYEQVLKDLNDKGEPSKPISITIPYSFATIHSIVTFLLHTFTGRNPMFTVGSHKAETAGSAQNMELVLQYQADATRLIRKLYQHFLDGEIYGVAILRTLWKSQTANRTVYKTVPKFNLFGMGVGSEQQRIRESRTVFEGNDVENIDPFMFFPDPNVPMSEVNEKGEYVFWRNFRGKHTLKRMEAEGLVNWIDEAGDIRTNIAGESEVSMRNARTGGQSHAGGGLTATGVVSNFMQIDQGSIEIIPRELGLGDSTRPEKWIFAIANKKQIIQAERLDLDHGKHPVSVAEPYTMGYGFGQVGLADYLGPMQDTISWFVNSHIHNIRAAMNNMFVVDPSMVEMQDLRNPKPGKLIRLKRAAFGMDVSKVISQFDVQDVTKGHITDLNNFVRFADILSAVTDNVKGIQATGGRKTATEVRTSGEAAVSRLASHAKLYSAQSIADLTEQMSVNTQQLLTQEFAIQILGENGQKDPIHITPEMVVGDFYYPIHDGTLPLDKIALLDVWKELLLGIGADEELRKNFDFVKMFEFVAQLGGAKNIASFKIKPDEEVQEQAAQGNITPLQARGGPSGLINALPEQPGRRLQDSTAA